MFIKKQIPTLICVALSQSTLVEAFELASEDKLSSVVIVAAGSSDALIHAASTTDDDLGIRYELMPFKTNFSVDINDTNEVAEEFEYAQVQAVDKQFGRVGQSEESGLIASLAREYLPSSLTDAVGLDPVEVAEGFNAGIEAMQSTAEVVFGQLQQTINVVSVSLNSITTEVSRYLESFSANNLRFSPDDGSIGSIHISDMQSTSNLTITAHE